MENSNEIKQTKNVFAKRNFYTIKDSGLVYVFALILPFVVGLVYAFLALLIAPKFGWTGENVLENLSTHIGYLLPSLLLTQFCFLSIYFAYHGAAKISLSACKLQFKKTNPLTAFICVAVGVICVFGFVWLFEGCLGGLYSKLGLNSSIDVPISNVGWLFLWLVVLGIVPAICEELIFRGVIFQGLRQKLPAGASIVLCGLLFALTHQNVTQLLYTFLLGCILSFVMEKTGNLIYPILIHLFNNVSTIVFSFLIAKHQVAFPTMWWGWILAILVAAATFAILWLIYFLYLRKKPKQEVEKVGQEPTNSAAMVGKLPLSMVCGIIFCVIMIVINVIA